MKTEMAAIKYMYGTDIEGLTKKEVIKAVAYYNARGIEPFEAKAKFAEEEEARMMEEI